MNFLKFISISFLFIISSSVLAGLPKYTLPSDEWRMISLPLTPPKDTNTIDAIFGDTLGKGTYDRDWVLYEFNASTNQYELLKLENKLEPGKGYWIIQITGGDKILTMPNNSYYTKPNPFPIELEPAKEANKYQWNLVGLPFNAKTKFNDLVFSNGVHNKLWRYKYAGGNGGYETIEAGGQLNPWDAFWTATDDTENSKITVSTFGKESKKGKIANKEYSGGSVYFPKEKANKPTPVIFYAPGYFTTDCGKYSTLLGFIASHGYTAICNTVANSSTEAKDILDSLTKAVDELPKLNLPNAIDTSKIGVMGFSSGGGHAFKILKEFSDKGWGENGRFLFVMEPWFAFDMTKADMKGLKDTNVVFVQFGKDGNNAPVWGRVKGEKQDPRILLTEYSLLEGIKPEHKDYQIFSDAAHMYPDDGDYEGDSIHHPDPKQTRESEMQGILRPLDALMEYTFENQTEESRKAALEVGTDTPYDKDPKKSYQKLYEENDYDFKCNDRRQNYCGSYAAHPLPW